MDAALLTGSDADGLSVLDVAHRVGLRVFEGNERDDEVTLGFSREGLVLRGDVLKERIIGQVDFVASLLEGDAEALLVLDGGGAVGGVYLDDVVGALALGLQHLQGFGRVAGGDDSVAYLPVDEACGGLVAFVAQGNEVTVTAHAVSTAGTGIGRGNGSEGQGSVVHEINLLQRVAQGQSHGRSSRRDMLEAGCCGQTRSLLQFLDKLPAVQGIEEIDVAGTAIQYFEGQFSLFHVNAGRFLVGVATILQLQFFHTILCF